MLDENNCIVINAPMGAKAHQLGRLIASCNDVVWYDHVRNGNNPWEPYNDVDVMFTKFHFNRRFYGSKSKGICDKMIPPVGSKTKELLEKQQEDIRHWCKKLYPNKFVYPVHDEVSMIRKIFNTNREVFIIPDLEKCFERWMKTSINYFVFAEHKDYTYGDLFSYNKKHIKMHLESAIQNLKDNVNKNVFVVNDVEDMLDEKNFKKLCKHLKLDFNLDSFTAVKNMINQ